METFINFIWPYAIIAALGLFIGYVLIEIWTKTNSFYKFTAIYSFTVLLALFITACSIFWGKDPLSLSIVGILATALSTALYFRKAIIHLAKTIHPWKRSHIL